MKIISLAAAALLAATTVAFAQNPNSGAGDPETRKNEQMPNRPGMAPGQQAPRQQMQQNDMRGQQQHPGTTGQAPRNQRTPAQSPGGAGPGNPQDPLNNPRR